MPWKVGDVMVRFGTDLAADEQAVVSLSSAVLNSSIGLLITVALLGNDPGKAALQSLAPRVLSVLSGTQFPQLVSGAPELLAGIEGAIADRTSVQEEA